MGRVEKGSRELNGTADGGWVVCRYTEAEWGCGDKTANGGGGKRKWSPLHDVERKQRQPSSRRGYDQAGLSCTACFSHAWDLDPLWLVLARHTATQTEKIKRKFVNVHLIWVHVCTLHYYCVPPIRGH